MISNSIYPNIGDLDIFGLRFGFDDPSAAEPRDFDLTGYSLYIHDTAPEGLSFLLDAADVVNGSRQIYMDVNNPIIADGRDAYFEMFINGGGNPYIDQYLTGNNNDDVELYLQPNQIYIFLDTNSDLILDGIKIDNSALKILALDVSDNTRYIDRSEIIDEAVAEVLDEIIVDDYTIFDGQSGGFPEQFGFTTLTPSLFLKTPTLSVAGYYEFEFLVFVSTSNTSSGLRYQLYTTAGTVNNSLTVYETYPNDPAGTNGICTGDTSDFTTPIDGAAGILDGPNRQGVLRIKGTVKFDGFTPGVIGIKLQSLGGAGSVQIQERSSLRFRQIA